jgi:hypothetical protein
MMHQPISPGASDRPTRRQLAAAARIAMGFRTLYNQTQTITAVRSEGDPERHYWRRLLDYGVSGNLQTTLDEYGHVLRESLGLIDASADTIAACSILVPVCLSQHTVVASACPTARVRGEAPGCESTFGFVVSNRRPCRSLSLIVLLAEIVADQPALAAHDQPAVGDCGGCAGRERDGLEVSDKGEVLRIGLPDR